MTEIATLILKVDLHCCRCSREIKKVLCKIQFKWRIQSIKYDEKDNSVTISGPFDPDCLSKKLRSLACRVILDIQIKKKTPPSSPKKPEKTETTRMVMKFDPADWSNYNNNNCPAYIPHYPAPPPPPAAVPLWPPCCNRPCPCYVEGHLGYCRCCTCGSSYNNKKNPNPSPPPPPPPPQPPLPTPYCSGTPAANYGCPPPAPFCYMEENPIGCAIM